MPLCGNWAKDNIIGGVLVVLLASVLTIPVVVSSVVVI